MIYYYEHYSYNCKFDFLKSLKFNDKRSFRNILYNVVVVQKEKSG